ncbi:MAG: FecR family protein [Phenylobacterium sp.]
MSADNIEGLAQRWVIREDLGSLTDGETAELQAWLEADPRHLGAYVRAQAAWTLLDRARALPVEGRRRVIGRLGVWAMSALAAAVVLAVGAGAFLRPSTFETMPGEIRTVRLRDGSTAVLDSQTRLAAFIRFGRRELRIERGEAWFQVAHDPAHPFVVHAGGAEVRAVGTAFSLAKTASGADVIVTQGVVEAHAGLTATPVRLPAGVRAALSQGTAQVAALSPQALDEELAWREGRAAFSGTPLGDAVARFNKYNRRKLVLASPELGAVSIVGWFKLNDPESFARAVSVGLPAKVSTVGDSIFIARAQKTDSR